MNKTQVNTTNNDFRIFKDNHREKLYCLYGMYADMKMYANDLANMVSFDKICENQFKEFLNSSSLVDEDSIE